MSQIGIPYELTGPDGTRAVFNDPSDPDFVGYLDSEAGLTILEGADVRESADDIPEGDGGVHGDFYMGRRSGVIAGFIWPEPDIATVMVRESKLRRATRALRGDTVMTWTQADRGQETQLSLRRQGRPQIGSGRLPKTFSIPMVAADWRVVSSTEKNQIITPGGAGGEIGFGFPLTFPLSFAFGTSGQGFVVNAGDAPATPRFRVDGPLTNPKIINNTTGQTISILYTLAAGEYLIVDCNDHTIKLGGSANRYSALDFTNTVWWDLQPGNNDIRLLAGSFSTGAQLTAYWRDSWE